jgi:putative ABC transport system permease protein
MGAVDGSSDEGQAMKPVMLHMIATLALRSIAGHRLRSALTILGVVIGVCAVVTMVTLGKSASSAIEQQIAALGPNVLQVRPGQGSGPGGGLPPRPLKAADADAIADQVAGASAVAPLSSTPMMAIHRGSNWSTLLNGTRASYFAVQPWPFEIGRVWTPDEEAAGSAVCILGATVRERLFAGEDPVGQRLRLGRSTCMVIGALTVRGQAGFGVNLDDMVLMPIGAVERRITGRRDLRLILVKVDPAFATGEVRASVAALLGERRHRSDSEEGDVSITDTRELSDTLKTTATILANILAAIAAISLVVGGINIMNIMLMTVTERTREIGIRLAIGALARDVLAQFLIEAVALSCLGGLVGLLLAQLAVLAATPALHLPWAFDPAINLLALLVSAAIGIAFGYLPARQAASLDPIVALRHE